MASFSDAHETKDIPIIASNLHRMILPRQNQIWAVLRETDDSNRIMYSLANAFLGRMCISGPIYALSADQRHIVQQATALYRKVHHIVKEGRTRIYRSPIGSSLFATGWQVVVRQTKDLKEALVVCHRFAEESKEGVEIADESFEGYRLKDAFGSQDAHVCIEQSRMRIYIPHAYSAKVFYFTQE